MEVIDVDSHVTVAGGLEDTPFQVLPDDGHLLELPSVSNSLRRMASHSGPISRLSRRAPPGTWTGFGRPRPGLILSGQAGRLPTKN
jgi:hypothetical protein